MIPESSPHSPSRKSDGGVIKPWLSGGLIVALAGYVLLSAVLIIKLSAFEDTKRQAQENQADLAKNRSELTSLKDEVDSLTKQKDALAPAIVGWEKRLKEKADAEAALAALEGKQRQTESDISQAVKRLDFNTRSVFNSRSTPASKRPRSIRLSYSRE
jgi:predicted  nucleic acid-binding Zn-ribbon protein